MLLLRGLIGKSGCEGLFMTGKLLESQSRISSFLPPPEAIPLKQYFHSFHHHSKSIVEARHHSKSIVEAR
jgi:hypothetical protein